MKLGSVVLALAGKEKGGLYIVVNLDEKYVYLADGKRLSAFKPKKKSLKHVKIFELNGLTESEVLDSNERVNAKIRKYLNNKRSAYVKGRCN